MFLINEYPRNVWSRNIGPHRETFYLPIKPIKKLLFITLSLRFLSDEGTLSTPRLPSYTPQWILNELHRSTIIFLFIIISSINRATFHNFTKIDTRSFFFFFFFTKILTSPHTRSICFFNDTRSNFFHSFFFFPFFSPLHTFGTRR